MILPDTYADYLVNLVRDRLDDLERKRRVATTPQEDQEIAAELELATRIFHSLQQ